MLKISPSILSADFADLEGQIRLIEQGGADYVHLDVMDGHFVPNISFGPMVAATVNRITDLTCDAHLMITDPDKYIEAFAKSGVDICTVHIEVLDDPRSTLARIRELGMAPALTLNPDTDVELILPHLNLVEQVLVMSVFPGFSGQSFIPDTLDTVRRLRSEAPELDIEIDGGMNSDTVPQAVEAGANVLVAASAIFKSTDIVRAIRDLRAVAQKALKREEQ
ncbi:MAG: ribulose-phosphate 3-epimerase [Planctomycetota bacterium]|nr:ribulose-phosphate 3-epimerase [Planctomycetota bacterium]